MNFLQNLLLGIHILCVAAMVILLLTQGGKAVKKLPKGFNHAGLTALVAGIAMVAIHPSLHKHFTSASQGIIGAKFLILIAILVLGFKYEKKESLSNSTWWTLLGLIVVNIGLASSIQG